MTDTSTWIDRYEAEAARLFKVHRSTISRLMREASNAA